ncbi:BON domain-containing protein [Kribbella orskensis]|uniref:BON domain-containing protein n=1 Tax=Kribbella orskensis TaxID=2512216 RepID=A0ABY2B678_9ACTN|nr:MULTISPECIES: CBS domain-containing protein [Kribbella]TCN27645.1 BON domain-containing protein [Kribbella sp. VKM Ac-2500]TCO07567.1 BON domain-containing protein [Kribbella orskensis]
MMIRELMTAPAVTVTGETSVAAALQLLDTEKITAMPVVDHRGALVGLVSEADLVGDADLIEDRAPSTAIRTSGLTPARRVAEVMTHLVVTVDPDDDLEVAIDLMRTTMMKSLPVVQHRKVVGMLSRSDIIHLLAGRDQRIRDDVADLLAAENQDWQVEVHDGIVTVTGPSDPHQRRLAEVLAGTVRGVVAIRVSQRIS